MSDLPKSPDEQRKTHYLDKHEGSYNSNVEEEKNKLGEYGEGWIFYADFAMLMTSLKEKTKKKRKKPMMNHLMRPQ